MAFLQLPLDFLKLLLPLHKLHSALILLLLLTQQLFQVLHIFVHSLRIHPYFFLLLFLQFLGFPAHHRLLLFPSSHLHASNLCQFPLLEVYFRLDVLALVGHFSQFILSLHQLLGVLDVPAMFEVDKLIFATPSTDRDERLFSEILEFALLVRDFPFEPRFHLFFLSISPHLLLNTVFHLNNLS